jgi:hypothetical protein
MTAHSEIVIDKFCNLCQWAYESWRTRRILFDDKTRSAKLQISRSGKALYRISEIMQDYWILQVSKLHDPASQQGQINLGIDYMIRFGGWDITTKSKLETLQTQLNELAAKIRQARNKILSHNDLETILNESTLGAFPAEADTEYFKILEEFTNIVCENSTGESWHYSTDVEPEAELLISSLLH